MKTKYYLVIVSIFLFSFGLYIISEYNYSVFHMVIEFVTLFIGISIFMVSLSAIRISKANLVVRLSPGIFVSTLIVFIHALAYEGMDFFVGYDANLPTQLWVISSSMQAVAFLYAVLFYNKKVNFQLNLIVFSVVGAILVSMTFLRIFPDCFVEGSGLTTFKINSEYLTILMYLIAITLLTLRKNGTEDVFYGNMVFMMLLFILAAFMFTQYAQVFAIQNFLGHIFRAIGLIVLYYTIVVNSVKKPLHTLFRQVSEEFRQQLIESSKKTASILDSTAEGIFGVDYNGICTFVNNSALEMLGYKDESEVLDKNLHLLIHHSNEDGSKYLEEDCFLHHSLQTQKRLRNINGIIWRKDNTFFHVEFAANPQYHGKESIGAIVSFIDVSRRIKYEESLRKLALIDDLTGLYNRRYYDEEIVNIDIPENYPISIIVSDINGLKFFNDSFGHATGDELILKITNIYTDSTKENDLVARMGGDEFVLVLPKTNEAETEELIKLISSKTEKERVNSLSISASYGYRTINSVEDSIKEAYKNAEDAMYQEKLITLSSIRSNATETILKTLYEKDPSSERHSRDVSVLCEKIAQAMELNRANIQQIHTAGLLHDIGKIIIPSEILNKRGVLTREEHKEMRKHPEIGFRILNSTRNMRTISLIILSHHERWDGTGYPRGIKGEDIPMGSRIISVADTYDAMTTKRTYRKIIPPIEALKEIVRCSGTQFDPKVVEILRSNFEFIIK